jgi:hypothetical protein
VEREDGVESTRLRKRPSASANDGDWVDGEASADSGGLVTILETRNGFVLVRTQAGDEGYVRESYVHPPSRPQRGKGSTPGPGSRRRQAAEGNSAPPSTGGRRSKRGGRSATAPASASRLAAQGSAVPSTRRSSRSAAAMSVKAYDPSAEASKPQWQKSPPAGGMGKKATAGAARSSARSSRSSRAASERAPRGASAKGQHLGESAAGADDSDGVDDVARMTVKVLREQLKLSGLNTTGNKADLAQRLREARAQSSSTHAIREAVEEGAHFIAGPTDAHRHEPTHVISETLDEAEEFLGTATESPARLSGDWRHAAPAPLSGDGGEDAVDDDGGMEAGAAATDQASVEVDAGGVDSELPPVAEGGDQVEAGAGGGGPQDALLAADDTLLPVADEGVPDGLPSASPATAEAEPMQEDGDADNDDVDDDGGMSAEVEATEHSAVAEPASASQEASSGAADDTEPMQQDADDDGDDQEGSGDHHGNDMLVDRPLPSTVAPVLRGSPSVTATDPSPAATPPIARTSNMPSVAAASAAVVRTAASAAAAAAALAGRTFGGWTVAAAATSLVTGSAHDPPQPVATVPAPQPSEREQLAQEYAKKKAMLAEIEAKRKARLRGGAEQSASRSDAPVAPAAALAAAAAEKRAAEASPAAVLAAAAAEKRAAEASQALFSAPPASRTFSFDTSPAAGAGTGAAPTHALASSGAATALPKPESAAPTCVIKPITFALSPCGCGAGQGRPRASPSEDINHQLRNLLRVCCRLTQQTKPVTPVGATFSAPPASRTFSFDTSPAAGAGAGAIPPAQAAAGGHTTQPPSSTGELSMPPSSQPGSSSSALDRSSPAATGQQQQQHSTQMLRPTPVCRPPHPYCSCH